jgi:hypothetical protein
MNSEGATVIEKHDQIFYREAVLSQSPGLLQPWGESVFICQSGTGCDNGRNRFAIVSSLSCYPG